MKVTLFVEGSDGKSVPKGSGSLYYNKHKVTFASPNDVLTMTGVDLQEIIGPRLDLLGVNAKGAIETWHLYVGKEK